MLKIVPLQPDNAHWLNQVPSQFTVTHRMKIDLCPSGALQLKPEKIPQSFIKTYGPDLTNLEDDGRAQAYFARWEDRLVGQMVIEHHWNDLASIEDLRVDAGFRRRGIAQGLMERAEPWARARGLKGLRLETQDINVGACQFYQRMGFTLQGFDRLLYGAQLDGPKEVALYFYKSWGGWADPDQ